MVVKLEKTGRGRLEREGKGREAGKGANFVQGRHTDRTSCFALGVVMLVHVHLSLWCVCQ
jgi:hypothetical protein